MSMKLKRAFYLMMATVAVAPLSFGVTRVSSTVPVHASETANNGAGLYTFTKVVYERYSADTKNPYTHRRGSYVVRSAFVNNKDAKNARARRAMKNAKVTSAHVAEAKRQAKRINRFLACHSRHYDRSLIVQNPKIVLGNSLHLFKGSSPSGSLAKLASKTATPLNIWFEYYANLTPRNLQSKLQYINHESLGAWHVRNKSGDGGYGRFQIMPSLDHNHSMNSQERFMHKYVGNHYRGNWSEMIKSETGRFGRRLPKAVKIDL